MFKKPKFVTTLLLVCSGLCSDQASPAQQSDPISGQAAPAGQSADGRNPNNSVDSQALGCRQPEVSERLTFEDLGTMVRNDVPKKVILQWVNRHLGELRLSPTQISDLQSAGADEDILAALSAESDIYLGWSVIPAQIVRDNYGRNIRDKFFGIDVAIANRSKDTIIVNTLEFCREDSRDVSQDPALVRGSLLKGSLTGRRTIIRGAIVGVGLAASPSAAFLKNLVHQNTFHTGVSVIDQFPFVFDLVVPETTAKFLENWDKDEVFKKGFVVPGGSSSRGRIFIPIELIYPKGSKEWKPAMKGHYDPSQVKQEIGSLVVLGQKVQLISPQRYVGRSDQQ